MKQILGDDVETGQLKLGEQARAEEVYGTAAYGTTGGYSRTASFVRGSGSLLRPVAGSAPPTTGGGSGPRPIQRNQAK